MQESTSNGHRSLKDRLAAREPLIGTFLKTPSAVVAEILAMTELDLLCLDAEHAPFDRRDLDSCIFAARAQGKPVLVRVLASRAEHVLSALDMGADGIVAPHIRNAAEARELVRMAHFGLGGRGYAGSPRAALYTRRTMAEHIARSSGAVVVVAMIEDVEALQNIDEILAVEGLDAVFVGRADLTVAYGKTDPYDDAVVAAVERVCAAARSAGRPLGMFVPKLEDVPMWMAQGASYFLLESDQSFLLRGAESLVQRFRAALVP
jgi:2-keto-3-deoxy-L-rhamnonate aldolase RhmA